jgi:hypothetical protein
MGYLSRINENVPIQWFLWIEKKKWTIDGIMNPDHRINSCLYVNG